MHAPIINIVCPPSFTPLISGGIQTKHNQAGYSEKEPFTFLLKIKLATFLVVIIITRIRTAKCQNKHAKSIGLLITMQH